MILDSAKNLLFKLDPETAHELFKKTAKLLPLSLIKKKTAIHSKFLRTELGGKRIPNPIGLAAGFDKNGEMTEALDAFGFGYLELGSVTAYPCLGQKKPRIFRIPKDTGLINRMGLPNKGADSFAKHIYKKTPQIAFGVNIAKTPDFALPNNVKISGLDDFLISYDRLGTLGQYTVLNLSCPNSGEAKLFEHPDLFKDLAKEIANLRQQKGTEKPLYIKISPDLKTSDLRKTVEIAIKNNFDGFVVGNTSQSRQGLATPEKVIKKIGAGGLSGHPINQLANKQLSEVYKIVGRKKTLIGVGGITSFADLLDKFSHGAELVQVYTGFVYGGPFFVAELNNRLNRFCKLAGLNSYKELIGETDVPWPL